MEDLRPATFLSREGAQFGVGYQGNVFCRGKMGKIFFARGRYMLDNHLQSTDLVEKPHPLFLQKKIAEEGQAI